jgi:hypothetical protein
MAAHAFKNKARVRRARTSSRGARHLVPGRPDDFRGHIRQRGVQLFGQGGIRVH